MAHFLYDICLFRWAKIGPIYLGNLFMFILFFGGPILFAWLNQKGYNLVEITIWSVKYIISYVVNLTMKNIVNNYKTRNIIFIMMIITIFIPNAIIKFIIILILSLLIINQNIEYKKKNYLKEYKFDKKVYFTIYFITLFVALWILKFSIFINIIPYVIITFHLLYWFIAKK